MGPAGDGAENHLTDRVDAEGGGPRERALLVDLDNAGNSIDAVGVEERLVALGNNAIQPELSRLLLDAIDTTAADHGQRQLARALALSSRDRVESRLAGPAAGIGGEATGRGAGPWPGA